MNLDTLVEDLKKALDSLFQNAGVGTFVTIVITLFVTAIVAAIVTRIMKKILHMSQNPLPASTIFVNITRGAIWIIGICVILSSCFNVNISAAITALGVGGIAISLGFQSTLSNLIGGLQISLTKVVEPGEHIKVGDNEGIVHDVTWRHTSIIDAKGERILIPNSIINSTALIKMHAENDIRLDVVIHKNAIPAGKTLDDISKEATDAVDKAVRDITLLMLPSGILFYGVNDDGYKGVLYLAVGTGVHLDKVRDAIVEAIKPYGHRISSSKDKTTVVERIQEQNRKMAFKRRKFFIARKGKDKRSASKKASVNKTSRSSQKQKSTKAAAPSKADKATGANDANEQTSKASSK